MLRILKKIKPANPKKTIIFVGIVLLLILASIITTSIYKKQDNKNIKSLYLKVNNLEIKLKANSSTYYHTKKLMHLNGNANIIIGSIDISADDVFYLKYHQLITASNNVVVRIKNKVIKYGVQYFYLNSKNNMLYMSDSPIVLTKKGISNSKKYFKYKLE